MARKYRNLRLATKGVLRVAGKMAAKGTEKTFRWMATDHTGSVDYSVRHVNIMETQQSINFILARMALGNRRVRRLIDRHQRLVDTGIEAGGFEIVADWIVDHVLYIWDLLWGLIEPIVSFIFWGLVRIVLIVLAYIVFFGVIYMLLTS